MGSAGTPVSDRLSLTNPRERGRAHNEREKALSSLVCFSAPAFTGGPLRRLQLYICFSWITDCLTSRVPLKIKTARNMLYISKKFRQHLGLGEGVGRGKQVALRKLVQGLHGTRKLQAVARKSIVTRIVFSTYTRNRRPTRGNEPGL